MVDVQEIDMQHLELLGKLEHLNEAVKNREPREHIYRIIDEVIAFTRQHFDVEEQLMVQSAYPEIEAHKKKHRELLQEALHLKEKLDYVGEEMFTDWFNHWPFGRVLAHIRYADGQMEEYAARKEAEM